MSQNLEQDVRDAAASLAAAITAAQTAGYRVDWPQRADGLSTIAISETSRLVKPIITLPADVVAEEPPATFGTPRRRMPAPGSD